MEDFVTWVDTSAIKKHIMEYNELVSLLVIAVSKIPIYYWILLTWIDFLSEGRFHHGLNLDGTQMILKITNVLS